MTYLARPLDQRAARRVRQPTIAACGNQRSTRIEIGAGCADDAEWARTLSGYSPTRTHLPEKACSSNSSAKPLATKTGIARLALHTGAAVVTGYAYWDVDTRNTNCGLSRQLMLFRRETASGTSWRYATVCKSRKTSSVTFPEQWVWVHARWKTRPKGEPRVRVL